MDEEFNIITDIPEDMESRKEVLLVDNLDDTLDLNKVLNLEDTMEININD